MHLTTQETERIIEEVIRKLPREIRKALDNVMISVEEAPQNKKIYRKSGKGEILLGLYHGVPRTGRSRGYGPVMPDYIAIYRSSIEKLARNSNEAEELLRTTLMHEIGHYFGLSESELDSSGY